MVGGNGGNAGAAAIQAQCEKDQVICSIVGVPKSIDNDILVVSAAAEPRHDAYIVQILHSIN